MNSNAKKKATSSKLLLIRQIIILVSKISVVLFVLISLVLFLISKFNPKLLGDYQGQVVDFFYPITNSVDQTRRYINAITTEMDHVINANYYAKRLEEVKQDRFKSQIELYLLKQENERLKKITNYLPNSYDEFYSARIISRNPGPYVKSAFIKSKDISKIEENNIVINEEGLVGQIDNVASDTGTLLLLTDKRSKVPVKTRNSGKRAILVGTGEKNPELDFILSTKKLIVGEEILSSGDGGIFPADIPVGYIEKIENDRVFIETYVDWNSLDYVFIIK